MERLRWTLAFCIVVLFLSFTSVPCQAQGQVLPGKVSLRSQKSYATSGSMKIFWNRVEGAQGYEFRVTDLNGKVVGRRKVEGKVSATLTDLAPGQFYRLRMRGYVRVDGKIQYGAASYTYIAQQPRVRFKWASRSAVKVSWTGVAGAADYSIYISDNPSRGFERVKKVKDAQAVLVGLNRNWKYYVYVVAQIRKGKRVYSTPRTNQYTFRLQVG